jgi:hypothetical protein
MQLTLDALQLLANTQLISLKADILPAPIQHPAAAHPIEHQQDERRVQRIGSGCFQESQSFG